MMRIHAIQPGMTRAKLLTVFTTEGGISNPTWRRYVYQDCPLIKVNVEFKHVVPFTKDKDGRDTMGERRDDKIVKISTPYLQWSIMD